MMNDFSIVAFEAHTRLKRARMDATSSIRAQFDTHRSSEQGLLIVSAKKVETFTNKTLSRVSRSSTSKAIWVLAN